MVFHGSLSDSKSPQAYRTILSILANLDNAVFRRVSIWLLISKFSSPFTNPFGIVPSDPTTIGITITSMSQFMSFSSKVYVLIALFLFF